MKTCRWSRTSHWPLILFLWKDPSHGTSQKHSHHLPLRALQKDKLSSIFLIRLFKISWLQVWKLTFIGSLFNIFSFITASPWFNMCNLYILNFQLPLFFVVLVASVYMVANNIFRSDQWAEIILNSLIWSSIPKKWKTKLQLNKTLLSWVIVAILVTEKTKINLQFLPNYWISAL